MSDDKKKTKSGDYYSADLTDPDRMVVRPKSKKKNDKFEYCKWARGDWEARFYIGTPTHREQCDAHIKQLVNSPCWFKHKARKVDMRAVASKGKSNK